MAESGGAAAFCGHCGARAQSTPFCQQCGASLVGAQNPVETWAPQGSIGPTEVGDEAGKVASLQTPRANSATRLAETPPAGTPAVAPFVSPSSRERPSRRGLAIGAAVLAIVLIGAAVGATLLLSKSSKPPKKRGPTYSAETARYLAPVLADNKNLAFGAAFLVPGGNTQGLSTEIATTQSDTKNAQQNIGGLTATGSSNKELATEVKAALISEEAWLQTAAAILSNTSSPLLSQLSGIGLDAQNKFAAIGPSVNAAASAPFPSSAKLVAFASAANASAQTTQQNITFSNQVLALLNQSTSTFQTVNTLYGQLQTAANGGYTDLTLPEAEQQINSIVASRTSLAAAAQALNAPTPTATAVTTDLVTAFNESLKDDNDLANCLNEANDGTVAYIFQSCLSLSTSDSATATTDKATFLAAYNQLRASVGQPPTSVQF
jgi:hypothetical protein